MMSVEMQLQRHSGEGTGCRSVRPARRTMPTTGSRRLSCRRADHILAARWPNRDPFFNELNTAFPANGALQRNAILPSEVSQLYGFCFNNPVNTFDTDGLIAPIPIIMAGLAIGNCAIGAYELNEYFKCMERARQINKQVTEKLPVEQAIEWCRKNRGQECTELLQEAAGRGLRCGLWGAGRLLLIKIGINPIIGGKAGGG
jgi:hypothetical protein